MTNAGTYPIDPTTAVGQVRLFVGDTNAVELVPPVEGQRSFDWFSDAELEQFLVAGSASVPRATGFAILQLAAGAALKDGRAIKTDDLSVGASTRGASLLAVAKAFFSEADAADASDDASGFLIVSPPRHRGWPEGLVHLV